MALDLWFRADVSRILQAAQEGMESTVEAMLEDDDITRAYQRGFLNAIHIIATAFGVSSERQDHLPNYDEIPHNADFTVGQDHSLYHVCGLAAPIYHQQSPQSVQVSQLCLPPNRQEGEEDRPRRSIAL